MRSEKGFTWIEVVVATLLIALISLGGSITVGQVLKVSRQNNNWSTAVRQTQNAGYWISKDLLTAESIFPFAFQDNVIFLVLYWKDWETGERKKISYKCLASADSLHEIERKYEVFDSTGSPTGITRTNLIAENIQEITLVEINGLWQISVTGSSGLKSVSREYQVQPRSY